MTTSETTQDASSLCSALAGCEYELLQLLPTDVAKEVWSRATRHTFGKMLVTWWAWPLMFLVWLLTVLSMLTAWNAAGLLGFGPLGRFLCEIVIHIFFFRVLHPVFQMCNRLMLPFIRQELLRVVEENCVSEQLPEQE
jgi:hypothetical protein